MAMILPRPVPVSVLLGALVSCQLAAAATPTGAAGASPAPAPAHPGAGLIHATVTLRDGSAHPGYLRWQDEDACWDHVFGARQRELPWLEYADKKALAHERQQREFASRGLLSRLAWAMHHQDGDVDVTRSFVCRYGDLAALRLQPDGDGPVLAVLRDGREVPIGGPSRDLGADLVLYPPTGEPVELDWDEVREIRFGAAPPGSSPYAERLTGTVEFRGGSFSGSLQWDTSECTSIDTIDADEEDVPLSQARRIARNRRGGCDVSLADGRVLQLSGSNDVGEGNRGAAVEVLGLGRVIVPWDRLVAADLRLAPAAGPAYADFPLPEPLRGVVQTTDGRFLAGRLVYDLDEAWTIDLLHGTGPDQCEYQVPFALLAMVTPVDDGACDVKLRDGRTLRLSGDEDTGDGHAGLLVFREGPTAPGAEPAKPDFVPWRLVRQVDFTR